MPRLPPQLAAVVRRCPAHGNRGCGLRVCQRSWLCRTRPGLHLEAMAAGLAPLMRSRMLSAVPLSPFSAGRKATATDRRFCSVSARAGSPCRCAMSAPTRSSACTSGDVAATKRYGPHVEALASTTTPPLGRPGRSSSTELATSRSVSLGWIRHPAGTPKSPRADPLPSVHPGQRHSADARATYTLEFRAELTGRVP